MDAVYQKRIGNFELVIKRDDDAPSPRDGDNVGQFWADNMHRRYNFHEEGADDVLARIKAAEISYLGTKADTDSWDDQDWIRYLMSVSEGRKHVYAIVPVYMYEHSGISLSCSPFSCGWDSGMIGFMICDREHADMILGEWDYDKVVQAIVAEVKSLNEYYVYGGYMYEVIEYKKCDCCGHEEEVEADTCCGFVGRLDGEDGVKEQIRWQLADEHKALIEDW